MYSLFTEPKGRREIGELQMNRSTTFQREQSTKDGAAWPRNVALAASVAGLIAIAGCGSSSANRFPSQQIAGHTLEPTLHETRTYIEQSANSHDVPDEYVAEARLGLVEIETALADAQAANVELEAIRRAKEAEIEAKRKAAMTDEEIALAEADKLREQYMSKQSELWTTIASRETALDSTAEQNVALLNAFRQERGMAYQELLSIAEQSYQNAQADIQKLRTLRNATEQEGFVALDDMRENARATQTRADATVTKLRAEADSTWEQAQARMAELTTQIDSIRERTQAESVRYSTRADSLERESKAKSGHRLSPCDTRRVPTRWSASRRRGAMNCSPVPTRSLSRRPKSSISCRLTKRSRTWPKPTPITRSCSKRPGPRTSARWRKSIASAATVERSNRSRARVSKRT
jgi:hypothetical protein